jgi:hypothetical protein
MKDPVVTQYGHSFERKEIELWFQWFVQHGVGASRCVCWALSTSGAGGTHVQPAALGGVQPETFLANSDGGEGVRRAFERFIDRIASTARR